MRKIPAITIVIFILFTATGIFAQPLPCPPINTTWIQGRGDTTLCSGGCTTIYAQDSTTIKSTTSYTFSHIPYLPTTFTGGTPILVGIDDVYSAELPLPFPFCFYGTKYNSCVIGANGEICFNTALAGAYCPWEIFGPIPGTPTELNTATLNTIMGPYYDIDPAIAGGTISWAIYGTAPCRTFVVSWSNIPLYNTGFCPGLAGTQQIVLYESTYAIDIFVQHKVVCTAWNNGWGILGIVDATGTNYNIPAGMNADTFSLENAGFRFTPNGPASWTYVWTDHSGTVVGSTDSIVVCPGDSMTYFVTGIASSNCDSYTVHSSVFINIGANPTVSHYTIKNPTLCGLRDGEIKLYGLVPGISDTIYYKYNGVLQPYVAQVAALDSSLTLAPLCAGVYDSIVVKVGQCHTAPIGPIILTAPPITIGPSTFVNPSVCDACDGSITIHGLIPSKSYVFNYTLNGVPQPSVTIVSTSSGTATLSGLCAGIYNNITGTANIGPCVPLCVSNALGPDTLVAPPPYNIHITASTNPTECGRCNGSITMSAVPPLSSDTVYYSLNGIPQTPIVTISLADSSIVLKDLCAGVYTAFSVKIGPCTSPVTGAATLIAPPLKAAFTDDIHFGCHGDTVFYTNASSSAGPLYYRWNFGDGHTDTVTNPMHIFTQGVYTVTLYATNHYCLDSAKKQDSMVHPLHAGFRPLPDLICQGSPVSFINITDSLSTLPLYYAWSFGDGYTSNSANPSHTYPNTGLYNVQLIATNFVPCHDTANVPVYVDSLTVLSMLASDTVLCKGTYITFTGIYTDIGNTGVTWSFAAGDSVKDVNPVTHAFNNTGTQTITVTPHYRICPESSYSRTVTVVPVPGLYLGTDTSICPGSEMIVLEDKSGINYSNAVWKWSTGETTPRIQVTAPGYYFVTVTVNGCMASDSIWVQNDCYMDIPNVFTPNGDGMNDYFYPRQYLSKGLVSFKMEIYNRWGQLLFQTSSIGGEGWDGRYNGIDQPMGVYVYLIDAAFKDGQKEHHQGNVTLLR